MIHNKKGNDEGDDGVERNYGIKWKLDQMEEEVKRNMQKEGSPK